jgi:hypothetical protein
MMNLVLERLLNHVLPCEARVVSQAESTGNHRVFFRLAALLVVASLAMPPFRALLDEKNLSMFSPPIPP